jgi:hypothetical protein
MWALWKDVNTPSEESALVQVGLARAVKQIAFAHRYHKFVHIEPR